MKHPLEQISANEITDAVNICRSAEGFDVSIETSPSRSDEADPQFGWRGGHSSGFRLKPEGPRCCRGGNRRS